MANLLLSLSHQISVALPLFMLVFLGYLVIRLSGWPKTFTENLNKFVFMVAAPAMLFRMMANFSQDSSVDSRLLIAFFGSCFIVFIIGRIVAHKFFKLDGTSGSVFAIGGIFSNNVMIGMPVAVLLLGEESLPSVALVIMFNGLILWSLMTLSIEWSTHGSLSLKGFGNTLKSVLKNPIIIAIIAGSLFRLIRIPLPMLIEQPLTMVSQMTAPLSLIVLGMGLAEYKITEGFKISLVVCLFKLLIQPMVIWALAIALQLPVMETKVAVLLGSMSVGVNVYVMSRQFNALTGPVATSLLLSTIFSALTTPLIMALVSMMQS